MFRHANKGLYSVLHRLRPTQWDLFLESPARYIAKLLYDLAKRRQSLEPKKRGIKIVCISDIHNFGSDIPYGDILIHTGVSNVGCQELGRVLSWLRSLPHPNKVTIPGPSFALFRFPERAKLDWTGITLLDDSSTSIRFSDGRELNIFGGSERSNTRQPGVWGFPSNHYWTGRVPMDTDVLISYMPPGQRFDVVGYQDDSLLAEMWRTRPRLQVSGYSWAGYGKEDIVYDRFGILFERIFCGSAGLMDCVRLTELLFRSIGFFIWRPRAGSEGTLVRTGALGQSKIKDKRIPLVVDL